MAEGLEVADLSFRYPRSKTAVLGDIRFRIGSGVNAAIVGPNGSGKSTLLNLLSGLFVPATGSITIDGVHVGSVKESIATVGNTSELFDYLTAEENSRFVNRFLGLSWNPVDFSELIERYGLRAHEHERIANLSRGTRKKVQMVVALMTNPRMVLADEPLDGLDAAGIEAWSDDCRRFNSGGGIVLSALHDKGYVSANCSAVVELGN